MRSLRIRLLQAVLVLTFALLSASTIRGVAHSASSYVAHITGTKIGLMFRTNPNDWNSRGGPAGYDGDVATLHCEVMGTPVGPYNNRAWYNATTRFGDGWIPDHFLDTPITASQWLPGLPGCAQSTPMPQPAETSVFFSGTNSAHGPSGVNGVADSDVSLDRWKSDNGDCSPTRAAGQVPDTATTLAGWSKGRLGPVYFLSTATDDRKSRMRTIILFDPGQTSNFVGKDTCDPQYDINSLLAKWLESNRANRLIVFTGWVSEEAVYVPGGKPIQSVQELTSGAAKPKYNLTFAGLWKYYFAGIWNQYFADQAIVCDYFGMSHEDVVRNFAWTVKNTPSACPLAKNGQKPVSWHP